MPQKKSSDRHAPTKSAGAAPARAESPLALIYVGIRGSVVAVRKPGGEIAWSTRLRKGSSLVPILVEGNRLYAVSGGELSCLDASSGKLVWHNPLRGFGMGFAALGSAHSSGDASS